MVGPAVTEPLTFRLNGCGARGAVSRALGLAVFLAGAGPNVVVGLDIGVERVATVAVDLARRAGAGTRKHADRAEHAKVDRTTFNAARICCVHGTIKRKGSDIPEQPHRASRLLYVPDVIKPLMLEQLQQITGAQPHTLIERPGSILLAQQLDDGLIQPPQGRHT